MTADQLIKGVVSSLLYSGVGLLVFVAGFFVVRLILPFDVHKELEVDHNTSVGLVVSAFILGLAIIVAAAIHG